MTSARDSILTAIRDALSGRSAPGAAEPPGADRTAEHEKPELPAAAAPGSSERVERFRSELELVAGEVLVATGPEPASALIARRCKDAAVKSLASTQGGENTIVSALESAGIGIKRLADLPAEERSALLATEATILTDADFGLAATGTLVFTPNTLPDRLAAGLPRWHIAVLPRSRLYPDLRTLIADHPESHREPLLLVTGPSRTADIEKQLVLGAHGPERLTVVLTE